jgi:hypothetical protein
MVWCNGYHVLIECHCVVDHGFEPGQVKPKIVKLLFDASLLSMQLYQVGAKTYGLGIRIMRPCGAMHLPRTFESEFHNSLSNQYLVSMGYDVKVLFPSSVNVFYMWRSYLSILFRLLSLSSFMFNLYIVRCSLQYPHKVVIL